MLTFPRVATLGLLLVLPACGGGSGGSTGPSDVPGGLAVGTVLTFVSGETRQPAASASVRVGAEAYTTDARGEIRLRRAAEIGATLTVESPAFLTRETRVRDPQETTFTLWPRADPRIGLSEGYTRALIYSGSFTLSRLPLGTRRVSIVPSGELREDPVAYEAHLYAADRLTSVTDGAVGFVVEASYSGGIPVTVVPGDCVTPSDFACVHLSFDRNYIIDAQIVVRRRDSARILRSTMLHELGHVFGLEHTPDDVLGSGDVMSEFSSSSNPQDFSAREQLAMRLMLQRRAGNRFPDNDAVLGVQAALTTRRTIACRLAP